MKQNRPGKTKPVNRRMFLAITIIVIANLFLGSAVSAKIFEVSDKDIEKVKIALDLTKMVANVAVSDDKLKTILNLTIKGGQVSTDVTYGLLVLSALNEAELVDLVVSQRYKDEAREYFNQTLEERTNLISYWKNIGYDLPKIISGNITGPMSALTLNAFAITNKTILIFSEFNVLRKEKLYDGLWYYFDLRKQGNEPHNIAWKEAKEVIGWAAKSTSFLGTAKINDNNESQLESQFSALWDKWGQYITPFGLSKEVKEQAKSELSDTIALALKTHNFAQKESKSSGVALVINALINALQNGWNAASAVLANIRSIMVKNAPLQAGLAINLQEKTEPADNNLTENGSPLTGGGEESGADLAKIQEEFDDISERADILSRQIAEMAGVEPEAGELLKEENLQNKETEEVLDKQEEPQEEQEEIKPLELAILNTAKPPVKDAPTICEKLPGSNPARNKVILNEVSWMGTLDSANNEWLEIKNISGFPVNLAGWQIIDKDRQIKIIFGNGLSPIFIPAGSLFLLERTDDNSLPFIAADLVYTGALNNANESLYLFSENCGLEDEVSASPDWPAGNANEKKTMERNPDFGWHTYTGILQNGIYGTPRAENSSPPIEGAGGGGNNSGAGATAAPPPPAEEESGSSQEFQLIPKILITEVQIASALSANDDFIELYNSSTGAADISGFQLKKKSSTGSEYSIRLLPAGTVIQAQSYFLWLNSDYAASSQILADATSTQTLAKNNSIAILDKDKNIIDQAAFGTSTDAFLETASYPENPREGESLGRKWLSDSQNYQDTDNNQEDFEIQSPTPKYQNQSPEPEEEPGEEQSEESQAPAVVINEVAWMGTKASPSDEWIELFNNTDQDIDITGWSLMAEDGSPDIVFPTSSIPASGFYLLERTDDNTISNILADWFGSFGSGGLKNDGEELELKDRERNLVDKVGCQKDESGECQGWFAGDNSTKQTMERINSELLGSDSGNWANNNLIIRNGRDAEDGRLNATPKAENSVSKSFTEIDYLDFRDFKELALTSLGGPYLVGGHIIVPLGKTLTIEPGIVVKFRPDSGIEVEGTLLAGESGQEAVVFTSIYDKDYAPEIIPEHDREPWPGDWDWLYFNNSFGSKMENTIVRYGGKYHISSTYSFPPFTKGMVQAEGGNLIVRNSKFEKSFSRGLWLINSSSSVEGAEFLNIGVEEYSDSAAMAIEGRDDRSVVKNSTFRNNKVGLWMKKAGSPAIWENLFENNGIPIKIEGYLNSGVLTAFSGNIIRENNLNGISLIDTAFAPGVSEIDWQKADTPFIINSEIIIPEGLTLTIGPGVIIKLSALGRIYVRGVLLVQGSAEEPIIFTALIDDQYGGDTNSDGPSVGWPGYWDFIYFFPSSGGSLLQNVVIRYGGFVSSFGSDAPNFGAVLVEEAQITIMDSVIENNLIYGIKLSSSDSIIENTIFRNPPIQTDDASDEIRNPRSLNLFNSNPSLTNSLFENNYYGIYVSSGDCPDVSQVNFSSNTYNIWPEDCEE